MVVSLTNYRPQPRYDGVPWTAAWVEGSSNLTAWSTVEEFTLDPVDADPTEPAARNFTTTAVTDETWLRVVFLDEDGNRDATDPVPIVPTPLLAEPVDVRVALGRTFSDEQEAQVEALIRMATINIYTACDKPPGWEPSPDAKPFLSGLCVSLVMRAMANPQALGQYSETIGSYSYSQTYARELPGSGLDLTEMEKLAARRCVYGSNIGSSRVPSGADDWAEFVWVWPSETVWVR